MKRLNPDPPPWPSKCEPMQPGRNLLGGVMEWSRSTGMHHLEVFMNASTAPSMTGLCFNNQARMYCQKDGFASYDGEPRMLAITEDNAEEYGRVRTFVGMAAIGDIVCTNTPAPKATKPVTLSPCMSACLATHSNCAEKERSSSDAIECSDYVQRCTRGCSEKGE
jgi:hypothetical protein